MNRKTGGGVIGGGGVPVRDGGVCSGEVVTSKI